MTDDEEPHYPIELQKEVAHRNLRKREELAERGKAGRYPYPPGRSSRGPMSPFSVAPTAQEIANWGLDFPGLQAIEGDDGALSVDPVELSRLLTNPQGLVYRANRYAAAVAFEKLREPEGGPVEPEHVDAVRGLLGLVFDLDANNELFPEARRLAQNALLREVYEMSKTKDLWRYYTDQLGFSLKAPINAPEVGFTIALYRRVCSITGRKEKGVGNPRALIAKAYELVGWPKHNEPEKIERAFREREEYPTHLNCSVSTSYW